MKPVILHREALEEFDGFIREPARRHFSREFPYGIIYVERAADIWIIAVIPLKRKPGNWAPRVS